MCVKAPWVQILLIPFSSTEEYFIMKGRFDTIKIRKFEAKKLREKGLGYLIITGHGTYNNILLTEDEFALKVLEDYRKEIKKN